MEYAAFRAKPWGSFVPWELAKHLTDTETELVAKGRAWDYLRDEGIIDEKGAFVGDSAPAACSTWNVGRISPSEAI